MQSLLERKMQFDLTDEEAASLLNLLVDTIEADRYPMSPRIRLLREILGKFGEIGSASPELAQKLRRYAPSPPARRPMPEERDPNRALRQGRWPRR
jgi:hypothetical protein